MRINAIPDAPIAVNGESLGYVEEFSYLGSLVSKDNAAQKTSDQLGSWRPTRLDFAKLQSIWKPKQYSLKTKVWLYNSNVKSVLCDSERWRVTTSGMKKIDASEKSAASSGPKGSLMKSFMRWPNATALYWRLNPANFNGWDMFSEWTRIEFQRPHRDGHQPEEGNKADLKQPGGKLWRLSWRRWILHGVKHNMRLKTGPDGGRPSKPYVQLGTKRIRK